MNRCQKAHSFQTIRGIDFIFNNTNLHFHEDFINISSSYSETFREISRQKALRSGRLIVLND